MYVCKQSLGPRGMALLDRPTDRPDGPPVYFFCFNSSTLARVSGEVRGLVPGSEHGFHIHEKGDCGNNGDASGGHFNPTGATHGKFAAPGSHAGELPSLVADAGGVARFSVEDHSISLTDGAVNNVIGRALIALNFQQQRNQRDQVDDEADHAGNGELDGAKAHRALLRAAKVGNGQRERGEHQRHGQHPAVAHAV
eukprot:gene3962-5411_t